MEASVIIGTYNEGDWIKRTVDSIRATAPDYQVVVVDDAGTDGSAQQAGADTVVRHEQRMGVAQSRLDGAAAASGEVLIFADGHHLFQPRCLIEIAKTSVRHGAIVWPCLRNVDGDNEDSGGFHVHSHGAYMACQEAGSTRGGYGVAWLVQHALPGLSRSGGMFVPYAVPRSVWPAVSWPAGCRSDGFTETNMAIKAWFAEVPILHYCQPGVFARHLFRHKSTAPTDSRDQWHNHAVGARVCFSDQTWREYLYPEVFRKIFPDDIFSTEERLAEAAAWQAEHKRRPDSQFWSCFMDAPVPKGVSHE